MQYELASWMFILLVLMTLKFIDVEDFHPQGSPREEPQLASWRFQICNWIFDVDKVPLAKETLSAQCSVELCFAVSLDDERRQR